MPLRVALHHQTTYKYARPVVLGPQVMRLRPAAHCRTPVRSYSLRVEPEDNFLNWQNDPYGNFLARLVFHKPADLFRVTVDLVAEMTVINPFSFFIEEASNEYPFKYDADLSHDLSPYLKVVDDSPLLAEYVATLDTTHRKTIDFLVDLNRRLQQDISYLIRLEPGVQSPTETLTKRSGSCRDSAWLLVQVLRRLGLAAAVCLGLSDSTRARHKSLDGPSGAEVDFTDLHAWCEVYLPGAGWVGLDPTSGLFAGEGHLPLAATPMPRSAAPISGAVETVRGRVRFSNDGHADSRRPACDQTVQR